MPWKVMTVFVHKVTSTLWKWSHIYIKTWSFKAHFKSCWTQRRKRATFDTTCLLGECLYVWLSEEHRRAAMFSCSLFSLQHNAPPDLPVIICAEVNLPWCKKSPCCGLGCPRLSYSYSLADSNEVYWSCKTQEKLLPVGKSFANVPVFYSEQYTIALIITWFISLLWSSPLC